MAASIFSGSRLNVSGWMSTNTGLMPFHSRECAVATKENGVVMTSPEIRSACREVTRASVPLFMKGAVVSKPFAFPDFFEIGIKFFQRRQDGPGYVNRFF